MKEIALEQVMTCHRRAEAEIANRITAIRLARNLGCSWDEIGAAMEMSRQTAHKRFGVAVGEPNRKVLRASRRLEAIAHAEDHADRPPPVAEEPAVDHRARAGDGDHRADWPP